MFLETERLILRKFEEKDFADYCEYAIDLEMCRMMGNEDMYDEASARPTFDWLMNNEERGYVLVCKENQKVIGNLSVCNVPSSLAALEPVQGKDGLSLSFCISRHYRRRGLIYEAVSAVISHLFSEEAVDYISCGHFDFNEASRALQNKLGFRHLTTERFTRDGVDFVAVENILWSDQWKNQ